MMANAMMLHAEGGTHQLQDKYCVRANTIHEVRNYHGAHARPLQPVELMG